jgi:hypothetical protein
MLTVHQQGCWVVVLWDDVDHVDLLGQGHCLMVEEQSSASPL